MLSLAMGAADTYRRCLVAEPVACDRTSTIVCLMGFVQNRMFILHHEGAHRLLFSSRKFNDLIGITIFGWLSF